MDSYLNENYKDIEFNFKKESMDDTNIINLELESKWKEIEEKTREKLKATNESRKLNDLNDFSIMRINLNSLIHQKDDSTFEDYCNLKIKQLEKMKQSISRNQNYHKSLIAFGEAKNNSNNINTLENNIKTFLKNDNDNKLNSKKYGKLTLNELIEMNKNQKSKKKFVVKKIFDILESNDNKQSNTINDENNFESISLIENNSDKITTKLKNKKLSFLKVDINNINDKNKEFNNYSQKSKTISRRYKNYLENNNLITSKSNIGNKIKNKINDNYNYLYSLYPNLKEKKY